MTRTWRYPRFTSPPECRIFQLRWSDAYPQCTVHEYVVSVRLDVEAQVAGTQTSRCSASVFWCIHCGMWKYTPRPHHHHNHNHNFHTPWPFWLKSWNTPVF